MEIHAKKNSVGVQWLKKASKDKGEDLYAWDGTSHVIHVETLLEVNPDLFHRSSRESGAGSNKDNNKSNDNGKGKSKRRDLFCSIDTCRGRCKGVKFENPAKSIGDAMKKSGKNSNRGGKSVDRVKRERDSSAERDEEKKKEEKNAEMFFSKKKKDNSSNVEIKKEEEEEEKAMHEITNDGNKNLAAAFHAAAAGTGVKKTNNNNSGDDNAKSQKKIVEWSKNVTGDTVCEKVPVPFNYITNRFMHSSDGKIVEEERYYTSCSCKRLASIFTSNQDDPVTENDVHDFNKGMCPTRGIDCGMVAFKFHVFKCADERVGFGIRATEDISLGSFICEYVGEILTREEAQTREVQYVKQGYYYLHDITGAVDNKRYSIDPTHNGNFGRFFNHSCSPNCTTLELPNNSQKNKKYSNPRSAPTEKERLVETMKYMPRLAFFACKDIKKGEQLTIDYSPGRHDGAEYMDDGAGGARKKCHKLRQTVECRCGERVCKGWLF